jgi:hypothetical protein
VSAAVSLPSLPYRVLAGDAKVRIRPSLRLVRAPRQRCACAHCCNRPELTSHLETDVVDLPRREIPPGSFGARAPHERSRFPATPAVRLPYVRPSRANFGPKPEPQRYSRPLLAEERDVVIAHLQQRPVRSGLLNFVGGRDAYMLDVLYEIEHPTTNNVPPTLMATINRAVWRYETNQRNQHKFICLKRSLAFEG